MQPARREAEGLPLAYTCAESQALRQVVGSVENAMDVCRTLFGTTTWVEFDVEEPRWSEVNSLRSVEEREKDFTNMYP